MLRKEWSLIANSLLVQFSVGLFLFFALITTFPGNDLDVVTIKRLSTPALIFAGPIVLAGMIISLFHLGNPQRAPRAAKNIMSSWLSREVIVTSTFLACWLGTALLETIGGSSSTLLLWLTVLFGILSVLSMANIYYSTGRAGWAASTTFTSFFGSVVIFGVISSLLSVYFAGAIETEAMGWLNIVVYLVSATLLLRLIHQWPLFSRLEQEEGRNMSQIVSVATANKTFVKKYKFLTILGLVCSGLGVLLLLIVLKTWGMESGAPFILIGALITIAGEILGRSGFYCLGLSNP
jgi:anaerobic dimethyl sulfoxide reductase subunit C (anchor subunit)